jgi:hypothetical protein
MCDIYQDYEPGIEPYLRMYHGFNCTSTNVNLKPGTYINDMSQSYPQLGWYTASMVVPPHTKAEITNIPLNTWKSDGTYGWKSYATPGAYDSIHANGQQWPVNTRAKPGTRMLISNPPINWGWIVRGINVKKDRTWDDHSLKCCNKTLGSGQCPGFYGPNSHKGCNAYMLPHCAKNPVTMNSPTCREWYLPNKNREDAVKQTVCNKLANLKDPSCRNWCRSNPGKCDTGIAQFCKTNPTDILCSCITSPVKRYNPACVDSLCIGGTKEGSEGVGGYVTASMRARACPNVVDCRTQIELSTGGRTTMGDVQVEQNCGNDESVAPVASADNSSKYLLIILILILMLVVAAVIGIALFLRKPSVEKTKLFK